jgi:hypothetical protein
VIDDNDERLLVSMCLELHRNPRVVAGCSTKLEAGEVDGRPVIGRGLGNSRLGGLLAPGHLRRIHARCRYSMAAVTVSTGSSTLAWDPEPRVEAGTVRLLLGC